MEWKMYKVFRKGGHKSFLIPDTLLKNVTFC